ncbi:MAG: bile acid:sodium symporter family protein [Solirubrobacteraceae bacterium]
MDSPLASVLLPAALAVVMLGLGLSLTVADFARVGRQPRVVAIALACQLLLLPAAAFGLVLLFDLSPVLAVGMMLLAASPGGTMANLFSHLFRGDVALNVSLTAINSVIAVVSVPLVTGLAIDHFSPAETGDDIGLQFGKIAQVFAIVLIPVLVGMTVRARRSALAARMDRPVRIASVVVLIGVILGTAVAERDEITGYIGDVGLIAVAFCTISLAIGYLVPRLLGVVERQAIACSMEIGIHNAALAITIATGVLDSTELAVPAAVYGVVMFPCAAIAGWLITRRAGAVARPA